MKKQSNNSIMRVLSSLIATIILAGGVVAVANARITNPPAAGLASGDIDTSAELAAILTDEVGTGFAVFNASPNFTGNVGVGTTSPLATLSLTGAGATSATRAFLVADSSDTPTFTVRDDGNVGVGTLTPGVLFTVNGGSDGIDGIRYTVNGNSRFTIASAGSGSHAELYSGNNVDLRLGVNATPTDLVIKNGGSVGIASTSPHSKLALGSGAITVYEYQKATSTTPTIDWRDGNQQLYRHGTAATTISFSNYVPGQTLRLMVCNPGGTAGAITWSGVYWPGGTAPTQTTTADVCDLWTFNATDATSTPIVIGGGVQNYGI